MVQNLAENPLAKLESRRDSKTGLAIKSPIRGYMRKPSGVDRANALEETVLLENVLMKISQLLQIGKRGDWI